MVRIGNLRLQNGAVLFTLKLVLIRCFSSLHALSFEKKLIIIQGCGNTIPDLFDLVPFFIQDKLEISIY